VPIYEFYCPDCHRVMSFLSRSVDTKKQPACPKCGRAGLTRRISSFAISKGRTDEPKAAAGLPGPDEARLEKAMEALAGDMEHINEDDPRQSAQLMRKLLEATGAPANRRVEEALKRLEAGENPEKIEEEMGDVLGEPFADALGGEAAEAGPAPPGRSLSRLARHLRPPSLDPELYEM
jgi:putative FmdB family regulatory protein